MNNLMILLPALPLFAAFLTMLGKAMPRARIPEIAGFVGVVSSLALLSVLYPHVRGGGSLEYRLGGWGEPVGIVFSLDGLAWISSVIGGVISLLALAYAQGEKRYPYHFYFFFLLLFAGMEGVILTGDLFNLFVFLEILSICSYILIAHLGDGRSLVASFKYLVISSLGIGFFLLGIFLLYSAAGTLSLRMIARFLAESPVPPGRLIVALVSLMVGVGVKASFVPFHTWLADAHGSAPHPVSAILSGVMIKVSFLVIWRLLALFDSLGIQQIYIWIGAVTALFGVLMAVSQTDAKKLLGYHSISQMGFILAAYGIGTPLAMTGAFYHLVSHSLFKSLLFLVVGVAMHASGERNIHRMGYWGRTTFLALIPFLAGAFSISGIPPFNGYASKTLMAEGLKTQPLAYALILVSSAATVASFIKLSRIFWAKRTAAGAGSRRIGPQTDGAASPWLYVPLYILAAVCAATGLLPRFFADSFSRLVQDQPLGRSVSVFGAKPLLIQLGVAAGGVLLHLLARSKKGVLVTGVLRRSAAGLNGSLMLLAAGFLVLCVWIWLKTQAAM